MKITRNTSDELVSNLLKVSAGETDATYQRIMEQLDDINNLIQTIDPQRYPQYLKTILDKMTTVHHALGGTIEAFDTSENSTI